MAHDDVGALILSIVALAVMTFALGIILVPVWSPELIPVISGAAIILTLVAQILSIRNAFRRRELLWIALIVLFGPVGVLAYSLVKATETGILTSYLEDLAQQVVGGKEEK
jgi:hypothetical protein